MYPQFTEKWTFYHLCVTFIFAAKIPTLCYCFSIFHLLCPHQLFFVPEVTLFFVGAAVNSCCTISPLIELASLIYEDMSVPGLVPGLFRLQNSLTPLLYGLDRDRLLWAEGPVVTMQSKYHILTMSHPDTFPTTHYHNKLLQSPSFFFFFLPSVSAWDWVRNF